MLESTPADQWLLGSYAWLKEKYKGRKINEQEINPLEYLGFEVAGESITIKADDTEVGSWIARELWKRKDALVKNGIGLKVFVGGKVVGDLPSQPNALNRRDTMLTAISEILKTTESNWLKRQVRGAYPNLQRIQSLQQHDGTVYLISAHEGEKNIIKECFPFLGLEDVLSTKSSRELTGKSVSYAAGAKNPGDSDPVMVGRIRARVIGEGIAYGHYQENYQFVFNGIAQELQAEYQTIDSDDNEAIVIVRNLDSIQKGTWMQRRKQLG